MSTQHCGTSITKDTIILNSKIEARYVTRNDKFKYKNTRKTFGPRKGVLPPKRCTQYGTEKVVDYAVKKYGRS